MKQQRDDWDELWAEKRPLQGVERWAPWVALAVAVVLASI